MVFMYGPAGGPGMAGSQSYEELLAHGGINSMPPAIEAEMRAHAQEVLAGSRAQLRWTLRAPEGHALAYVSAAIDDATICVQALDADTAVLWTGSLPRASVRLSLVVGFIRPWRQPGARTVEHTATVALRAGEITDVTTEVRPDFSVVTSRT